MKPFHVTLLLIPLKLNPAVSHCLPIDDASTLDTGIVCGPPNFPFAPQIAFPTETAGLPLGLPAPTPTSTN